MRHSSREAAVWSCNDFLFPLLFFSCDCCCLVVLRLYYHYYQISLIFFFFPLSVFGLWGENGL